jgi:hypothetical protein
VVWILNFSGRRELQLALAVMYVIPWLYLKKVPADCVSPFAGYMHWKQLLVLLLGCVSAPLESHTSLFVAILATLTAQLQLGFGLGSSSGSNDSRQPAAAAAAAESGGGEGSDVGAALLGGGLVEELLPDSFLKQAFRGFFEMLQESGADVPAELLTQVGPSVSLHA